MDEKNLFIHHPVLLEQSVKGLAIKPTGIYVDGTLGGGGHAAAIVENLGPDGLLVGIDRDKDAIAASTERLKNFDVPFIPVWDNHDNIQQILQDLSIKMVDGFLLDLGVSSFQLDTPSRGFSYRYDSPLDMRMDHRDKLSAYDVVNKFPEKKLAQIIKDYGEERYAKGISKALCRHRINAPIESTLELAQIITDATPKRPPSHGHPAARTFQAIRIVVNSELIKLSETIEAMAKLLAPKGRICIITFHSLEDRIVKQAFKYWSDPCLCPRDIPYCVCKKEPLLSIITRKPIKPNQEEITQNPRSHSAKLRICTATLDAKEGRE